MIETFACFGLLTIYLLGTFTSLFNNYYELFNAAYAASLMFIIFGRFFVVVAEDRSVKENKRILFEGHIYIACVILMVLGYLYFSNIWEFFIGEAKFLRLSIFLLEIASVVSVKIHQLRSWKSYGKHYVICHIIDVIIVTAMMMLDFFIDKKIIILYNWIIPLCFILIILIAIVNKYILRKLEYWVHLKAFEERVRLMVRNGQLQDMIIPPSRNLQTDLVYNHCIYILDKSTFRILECHKLSADVKRILLEEKIDYKSAQLVSSQFLANLNNNLMRRKYDNSVLPTIITSSLQKRKTKIL